MKDRLAGLLLFFVLAAGGWTAQGETYPFHRFSTADGLLNNEVKALLRDYQGFLWVGTAAGLNRYDGYRWKTWPSSTLLPEGDVERLWEDGEGRIWIAGRNRYALYSPETDRFTDGLEWLERMSVPVRAGVSLLHVDAYGDVWTVAGDSLYRYCCGVEEVHACALPCRSSGGLQLADDGERLFLMDGEGRLFGREIPMKQWKDALSPSPEQPWEPIALPAGGQPMNRVYRDRSGGTWLYSTLHGELCYRQDGEPDWQTVRLESEEQTQSNFTRSLQDDGQGSVWIATDHRGLFLYDKERASQLNLLHRPDRPSSLAENSVVALCLDREGALWVGHVKKGLSCYHPSFRKFVNVREPGLERISALLPDHQGRIWIGTDGYGLFCRKTDGGPGDGRQGGLHVDIPGNIVVTLLEDDRGRIWIGTYLNGLLCYEAGRMRRYTTDNSPLADNSVYALRQDRRGCIWIGTLWGHMQCLHPDTGVFEDFPSPQRKEQSVALCLYEEGGDTLYAGTLSGLCLTDIVTGRRQMFSGNRRGTMKFREEAIQAFCKDSRGCLWLGHNRGITVWDTRRDTLYYLDKGTGLCDDVIRAIAEDDRGRIWVTTSNGCSVLAVDEYTDGELSFYADNYSVRDGLPSDNFSRHSLALLPDGRMLLGSVDGYSLTDPLFWDAPVPLPFPKLVSLQVAGEEREAEHGGLVRLERSDRPIRLDYTALNLLEPSRTRYAYCLEEEGREAEWHETDAPFVTFSSLPSGRHRLWLMACNAAGQWCDASCLLTIEVALPFYRSPWAILCYLLLALLVFLGWRRHRERERRIRRFLKWAEEHCPSEFPSPSGRKGVTPSSSDWKGVTEGAGKPQPDLAKPKAEVAPSDIFVTSQDELFLRKAIRTVEEHIDDSDFSVEELSAALALTRGHLYKRLMALTGKSPSDFIRLLRLKRARQLLAGSGMQVAEVAYSVGFSSPKVFSRNFKAEFGMTPTEYVRTQEKGGDDTSVPPA